MEFSESTKTLTERARNDLLKDHKMLKWQDRGVTGWWWWGGGSVGFFERDALIMLLLKRKTEFLYLYNMYINQSSLIPLFDVDSSTLPFLVEEG